MSIIIVGVGEVSFKAVEFLDGDSGVLKSVTGEPAKSPIARMYLRSVFPAVKSSPVTHQLPDFLCWHWCSCILHSQLA
uniref:Uncharacterized protein n=1 Tax=Geospiza parvula TaxID=87175 RepID=A0A8C3NKG9_GEOPR